MTGMTAFPLTTQQDRPRSGVGVVRNVGLVAGSVALVVGLSACGGGSGSSSSTTTSAAASGSASGGHRMGRGISGVISAVAPSTVTVQSNQGATETVHYGSTSKIESQQPSTASAVKVGSCISARPNMSSWSGSGGSSSASPTAKRTAFSGSITAGTVTVMPTSSCSSSTGGGFGLTGTVTSISGNTIKMQAKVMKRSSSSTGTKRDVTVTTTSSTTYNQDTAGSQKSLQPGMCVTASGVTPGSTKTARSLVVSQSNNGSCSMGGGSGA